MKKVMQFLINSHIFGVKKRTNGVQNGVLENEAETAGYETGTFYRKNSTLTHITIEREKWKENYLSLMLKDWERSKGKAMRAKELGVGISQRKDDLYAWYNYWIGNVKGDNIRFDTRRNYNERYEKNIEPLIGDMLLKEVKPLHCQNVLN